MITRSFAALSSAERQVLRSQQFRSGQCIRCFHASLRQRADQLPGEGKIEDATPSNLVAKPRPTRKQRAAMISNEVQMIQKGPPPGNPTDGPGSVRGTYQKDPEPPSTSAGFIESPQSMGGERMGENVSAGREGVNAQGVGRVTGNDENVRNEHPSARGSRTSAQVQEPSEGGVSVLEASTSGPPSKAARAAIVQRGRDKIFVRMQEDELREKLLAGKPTGVSYKPKAYTAEKLLESGMSSATMAGKHGKSAILDRIRTVASPGSSFVKDGRPLSASTRHQVAQAMVAGSYHSKRVLNGRESYKIKSLNEARRKLAINGTYLEADARRVMEKIEKLMPTARMSAEASKGPARAAAEKKSPSPRQHQVKPTKATA